MNAKESGIHNTLENSHFMGYRGIEKTEKQNAPSARDV